MRSGAFGDAMVEMQVETRMLSRAVVAARGLALASARRATVVRARASTGAAARSQGLLRLLQSLHSRVYYRPYMAVQRIE